MLPGLCRVSVDKDGMKAWLEIRPDTLITSSAGAGAAQTPESAAEHAPVYRKRACTSLAGVMEQLARNGVVFGILRTSLEDVLNQAQEGLFLAAMGVEPTLPVDEEVEIYFEEPGKGKPVISADGDLDYFELKDFPSVAAGEILACKKAGIPGKNGRTVTGKTVPAKPPARVFLEAGSGVELVDGGRAVRATLSGRPEVVRRGRVYRFSVTPVLEIEGDVSRHTGNVRFKGNVRVDGSVNEGMQVQAQGDIEVHGSVTGAVLEATGDVIIHGAVASSEITAGIANKHLERYVEPLDKLINHLGKAILAARDLENAARERGRSITGGEALDAVISHKYSGIPAVVRELDRYRREAVEHRLYVPAQLNDGIESAASMFLNNPLTAGDLKEALKLLSRLRFAAAELTELARPKGNVFMYSVANTFVEAARSIYVTGCGAYTSVMHAGEDAVIDGALRGGSLKVGRGVIVNRSGSRRGLGTTEIHLSTTGHVRINTAYPELIIRVGPRSATVRENLKNLRARYDKRSGRILVEGMPAG